MASSDKELEQQLVEAGNKLLQPLSSVDDELLLLLDRVESCLSRVEQSPAISMHDALSPLIKSLVADELLRHSDVDVKVAVASCVSEITRISAPNAPYDDDKMKDVFQLIVSSFENFHDECSRSYSKRALVLETVAKVRSCVIMLDLECDKLITEMFQHFLKEIRDFHSEDIFTYMATIMTVVLEESEEVTMELLTPLLATVKKHSKEVTPIAKKLVKTVFANCAPKLKPYLAQAVESLDLSLDEYSKSLTSVLEGTHIAVELGNDSSLRDQLAAGSKVARISLDEAGQMAESVREESCSDDVDHAVNKSSKSITSNGVSERNGESAAQTDSLIKVGNHDTGDLQDAAAKMTSKSDSDDSMVEKSMKSESRSAQAAKESAKKANSLINSAESSFQAPDDNEKEADGLPECRKNQNSDSESSTSDEPACEGFNSLEKKIEANLQHSTPKESEGDAINVAPTSPSRSLADECVGKKAGRGRPKKKKSSNKKQSVSKEVSEGTKNLEAKQVSRPSKEAPLEPSHEEKEDGSSSDAEAITPKQLGKKNEPRVKSQSQDGPSTKKDDGKKRAPAKARLESTPSPDSPDKPAKDEGNQEEITKSAKRKQSSGKDRATEDVQYDESLVGLKVKVWWPHDRSFYEGVISAFDSGKRKHTVSYDDGEIEVLNLRKERWEFIQGDEVSEEDQIARPDVSSVVQKKKGRTIAESSAKHAKVEASPNSNLKGKSTKSGLKSRSEGKSDGRNEDDEPGSKSKAQPRKSTGKSVDDAEKVSGKSNIGSSTPKSKSEQESSSKTATKSKGKTPQSGSKPNANGTGKAKSSSSKVKETSDRKEKLTDPVKTPESTKDKLSVASKEQVSETKSGKKRGRGKR
ncbi:sister chromatid cohesion protein PDS5 homolog C-like isoform X2 [Nicotiana sylvestris]|uniref:Nucleolar and coiled-body phosphoprotein 1-like isoform X1 n=1 Tax=Nicotiana sylvestris TaxID=4096 RepID=A0A1U7XUM7_NICSY|nr:PREDICTED: nucleolar and coiled-body phosphoprotein 1-like isoform X1 [Nicotiana sylvestris]